MPPKHIAFAILSFAFIACSGSNAITYGGQTYKTVKIGTQTWMAENLNYEAEVSLCYDNNPDNCAKYGRLYNWETAMKVCPEGWHLPSDAEWDKLLRFVEDDGYYMASDYSSGTAGKHLKAVSGWDDGIDAFSDNGTDKYGFSALPGGEGDYCLYDSSFGNGGALGGIGGWWSANEYSSFFVHGWEMLYSFDFGLRYENRKYRLFSVRCVQDGDEKSGSSVPSSSSLVSSSSSFANSGKENNISNYRTVVIGTQTWMAENLNYETEGSVCYDNNPDNCAKYGRLYDWEAAMKACPNGWHLPSYNEWEKLLRFVDGYTGPENYDYSSSKTAGKYLKATSGWNEDGNGTDAYGFSALPGGSHRDSGFGNDGKFYSDGRFEGVGIYGIWWSVYEKYKCSYNAPYWVMRYNGDHAGRNSGPKSSLYSVRCVKD